MRYVCRMRLPLLVYLLAGCPGSPRATEELEPLTPAEKNVAACETWLEAMTCGDYDYSTVVDCHVYDDYGCDVSDYFNCLTENTVCDEATGVADTTDWTECAYLADCDE